MNTSGALRIEDVETANNEAFCVHDQLPSVDEAKLHAQNASPEERNRGGSKKLKLCVAAFLLVVASAIVIVVAVVSQTEEDLSMGYRSDGTSGPSVGGSNKRPIHAPETASYADLIDFLSNGVSDLKDLQTLGSPQQRAAAWLATEDSQKLLWSERTDDSIVQRFSAAVFYFALGGESWPSQMRFLSTGSECTWNMAGFGVDQRSLIYYGIQCNAAGKVNKVHIPADFMKGTFPQELSFFEDLEFFDIYGNPNIADSFPSFLKGLKKLKHLGLHYCKIKSPLPDWLSSLSSMESLVLSNNDFYGSANVIGRLTNLKNLYLDDNKELEGDISIFSKLSNPKYIVLEDNKFTGSLDEEFFEGWTQLEVFDVSHNSIVGSIPSSMFAIEKLRVVDLHDNLLNGQFPSFKIFKDDLEVLNLRENNLSGQIPRGLYHFEHLRQLDLSMNAFTGTIPVIFERLSNLEIFFVAGNPLTPAPIPGFLSSMTSLKDLSLKATSRTGTIPRWIGSLSNLVLLDLDKNELGGSIPPSIGELKSLEYLFLNRNELEGTIPSTMGLLTNLELFMIDKNEITGSTDSICIKPETVGAFVADCGGTSPLVDCPCCTLCCEAGDESCNDSVWMGDINPIWELAYKKSDRVFDAPSTYSHKTQFHGEIP